MLSLVAVCPVPPKVLNFFLGSIVTENQSDEHVDTDVSHASVLHSAEPVPVSPSLDDSFDAVRSSKKRQVGPIPTINH